MSQYYNNYANQDYFLNDSKDFLFIFSYVTNFNYYIFILNSHTIYFSVPRVVFKSSKGLF